MLYLRPNAIEVLKRRAARYSEIEICGMLWEHPTSGEQVVWSLRNTHVQPDRFYAIDPDEMKQAYQSIGQHGWTVLAFYHSHPNGKPDPSEADMEGALNEGLHYIIVYPKDGTWELSAWDCIETGILLEDKIEVRQ